LAAASVSASIPAPTMAAVSAWATGTARRSTTAAFALRTSFIHHQRPPHEILSVQSLDRFFRFAVVSNFCKSKSPRLPRKTILQQTESVRMYPDSRKQLRHLFFCCFEREIPDV
jgi:hypothetical protein